MARDGVAVDAVVAAAVVAHAGGERVNVAALCRDRGISRKTFYKFVRRFQAEGLAGLFPRSRRPHRCPAATPAVTEDAIVRARKELADTGWDNGAISIMWRLTDAGELERVPSRATIHRVLVRRGMVIPAPRKRPTKTRWRRFTRPRANELWQIDGFEVALADASIAVVIQLVDDHSRLDLGCHACRSENGQDVWAAFTAAAASYGLPAQVLTDNGGAFSGARRGWVSPFEANLRQVGVDPITASPAHPQTCGKNERAHGTAERWLARQATPADLVELQALLDRYRVGYNTRRHQALHMLTPQQVYDLATKTGPAFAPRPVPLTITYPTVSIHGSIGVDHTEIGLGRRHAGATATAFRSGDEVTIFVAGTLVRTLTIDRTRRYQAQRRSP